jgi:galactose mutarotase-like enzyme
VSAEVRLEHGASRATISPMGAEGRTWSVGGAELLWPSDPAIWSEISPILYPVVGWTRDGARVAGKHYDLQLHGFARKHIYALETKTADFARFVLTDNEATRAIYPFAFRFAVEYALGPDSLSMTLEVENTDGSPAPYACGLHPCFNWPFAGGPREGAIVRFEKSERPAVPVIAPGGLIGRTTRPVPLKGHELALSDDLFAGDALCFLNLASRSLRFEQADGSAIEMAFPGFEHCGLWMRPGGRYLCLEPWTGYSDPEDFSGELQQKPGMKILAPGALARHSAIFRFANKS